MQQHSDENLKLYFKKSLKNLKNIRNKKCITTEKNNQSICKEGKANDNRIEFVINLQISQ